MSWWPWALAVVVLLVVGWTVVLSSTRGRRLHRLHIRTDAARDGLESALRRRAAAAVTVAEALERAGRPQRARPLRTAAAHARVARGFGPDREAAENALGRVLGEADRAVLPPAVLEELADAEQLLLLARRVHNDAVRDTLALRSRRLVRWLHLAGIAPMPTYFEIADPEPRTSANRSTGRTTGTTSAQA
jgi:hypothetical protein